MLVFRKILRPDLMDDPLEILLLILKLVKLLKNLAKTLFTLANQDQTYESNLTRSDLSKLQILSGILFQCGSPGSISIISLHFSSIQFSLFL